MTEEQRQKELSRLHDLYYQKEKDFERAATKRLLLVWFGFFVAIFIAIYALGKPAGIDILWYVVISIMASGFLCYVLGGIHLWLNGKDREESDRLAAIKQQLIDLAKEENNGA